MSGMLSSARVRRRLTWFGGILLVAGAVAGLIAAFPSPKPSAADKITKVKARVARTPKTHSFEPRAQMVFQTARMFIKDAVEGRNLGAAWQYVGPKMRTGFTKRSWVHGSTLPFTLYPVDPPRTRFNLSFSYANEVGMRLLVFARPHTSVHLRRMEFDLVERKYGHRSNSRWLVSSFTPAPISAEQLGAKSAATPVAGGPGGASDPTKHTSAMWLFLPLGIFVGLLLGLAAFFGIRSWRNAVAYREYFEGRQTSTWRPS